MDFFQADEIASFNLDSPPLLHSELIRCKKSKKYSSTITNNDLMDMYSTSSPEQDDNSLEKENDCSEVNNYLVY